MSSHIFFTPSVLSSIDSSLKREASKCRSYRHEPIPFPLLA
ncbi:hypothetical protein FH5_02368 [Priestia endophytica]|nr:hypothetical protein FH5_02368 [Priestia endophytica]